MKWVAFVIAVAGMYPLTGWLRRYPSVAPKVWIFIGLSPYVLDTFHLFIAVISWADWPGYVKGLELSILDVLAVTIYLTLPRAKHPLPFRFSMALYFLAASLAVFQAQVPIAAIFYPWQLARVLLLYTVVTKACAEDDRVMLWLLKGMGISLCAEAILTIWQRFGLGVIQASGTFPHQNFLGTMAHFATFPAFALLLAGQPGWQYFAIPLASLTVSVLTASRATLALVGFGFAAVFLLSVQRGWSSRKAQVAMLGAVAIAAFAPIAQSSLERRFAAAPLSGEYDERAAFEDAAKMILWDHPMGIAPNSYVVAANLQGYNERAGVAPVRGSGSANVHNIYLLVAAESGYLGLITFVIMLLPPMVVAFRSSFRNRKNRRGDLLLGCGVALLAVYIQSFFEWIFITFQAQYVFAIVTGMVAGTLQNSAYRSRRAHAPSVRLGASGKVRAHRSSKRNISRNDLTGN